VRNIAFLRGQQIVFWCIIGFALLPVHLAGCGGCDNEEASDPNVQITNDDPGDSDGVDDGQGANSDAGNPSAPPEDAGTGSPSNGTADAGDLLDGVPEDAGLPTSDNVDAGDPPSVSFCGDAVCDENENCSLCSQDCGECVQPPVSESCGNGVCDGEEGCYLCPSDCGPCVDDTTVFCGDDICAGSEGCQQCPDDCGTCPEDAGVVSGFCGDTVCSQQETCESCEADCDPCAIVPEADGGSAAVGTGDGGMPDPPMTDSGTVINLICGDGICSNGETPATCWQDCGTQCGDNVCNGSETCETCETDCGLCEPPDPGEGYCGDGWCSLGETTATCWQDCGSLCGDGACNSIEDCANCELDCGVCEMDGGSMDPTNDAGVEEEDCKGPNVIGNPCDDGDLGTRNDICVADGLCQGEPFECQLKECQVSSTPNGTSCDIVWAAENSICEDGLFCTVDDKCIGGLCSGEPRDCSSFSNQCRDAYCHETLNICGQANKPDGDDCDDDLYCTVGDSCFSGQCVGEARDCSEEDDQCNRGKCNETEESCEKRALTSGTACEDGDYCSVDDTCLEGVCEPGGNRDCSWVTELDSCYDGECNTSVEACLFVDNNTCVDCVFDKPNAHAGDNQTVPPDETVYLNGSQSSSPISSPLSYSWEMVAAPTGTNTQLYNSQTAYPFFLGDVSGEYVICLTVTDDEQCESDPACVTVQVRPQVAIHVELTWDANGADVDLHYLSPQGNFFNYPTDCYYGNKTPDWGSNGLGVADGISGNDPRLDLDNTSGYGPENLNQDEPFDTLEGYRVAVHLYCASSVSSTVARVRIYVNGGLAFETSRTIEGADFWNVADISVWGDGSAINITGINDPVYKHYSPSCH
jgi:hypothetical protein